MTYSRPGTSTVDALERISAPNAPSIIGDSRTTISANGRVIDARSPGQLARNGEARAAEITGFIEGLTKVATPIIKDQLTKQAYNQVGELLKTQDPLQLIRSGDETQRALVRSLSPQAQDILNDKAAQGAVRLFQETYSAERTKRSAILQSTTASPEDKAKAETDAKSAALTAAGVTSLPPSNLVAYADQMAQTEAALKGLDYKETLKNQTKDDRAKLVRAQQANIARLTDMRTTVAGNGDATKAEQFVVGIRSGWEEDVRANSAAFTPLEQAEIMAEAMQTELARLTSAGDWQRASQVIGSMEVLSQAGPKTDSGVPFFDQRLSNGYTLGYMISSASDSVQKGLKNWENEQAFASVRDLMPRALAGEDVMPELLGRMGEMTPEQIMQIAPSLAQLKGIGNQASNQQIIREAELQFQIRGMAPDKAMEALRGALASGQIKPGQFGDLVGRIGKDDPKLGMIDAQKASLSGELTQSAISIARAAGITDPDEQREYIRTFSVDITKATEKRLAELQAKGEPINETVVRSVMRNEIEAAQARRVKDRKQLEQLRLEAGPRNRVTNELQELQQNVQSSGGNVTVMSFSKPMRVDFQQAHPNKPMTVDNLLRYQADRMRNVPADGDGKPAFENPQQMLKDMIERSKPDGTVPGRNGQPGSTPFTRATTSQRLLGIEGDRAVRNLLQWAFPDGSSQPAPKPAPGAAKPQAGQEVSAKPAPNTGMQLIGAGLELVANVVTPPAAAATLDKAPGRTVAVENQAAVDTLMRLWRGGQRVQMNTPPLPQLSAQTPVQMVGTAITNVMHPIFVAIGIAEGTRTPSGGYTKAYYGHRDPGSGAWNKGTVSGQNAPNAQLVDRQWMARLSSTSTRIAPVLQQLGFAPGTQGYNRLLFNVLDLTVQAPAAAQDFIKMLPKIARAGGSIEAIAKARADSFINPATGRLEAGGFGNSYSRLLADQRSRAGAFDYKRRI
jgi:hypothetical protein